MAYIKRTRPANHIDFLIVDELYWNNDVCLQIIRDAVDSLAPEQRAEMDAIELSELEMELILGGEL